MKNYIGLNIRYLCESNFLSQDEFGAKFGLKKSVVGTYVRGISNPKVEIMQKICDEYHISLDELINEDLYLKNKGYVPHTQELPKVEEPASPVYEAERDAMMKTINAQQETIAAMKITIDTLLGKK